MIANCRFENYNRTKRYTREYLRSGTRGEADVITVVSIRFREKGTVRDRSRGHRGTIRRDRREATTGRKGIKIEITSRTQGGACNGWIASPTLSPFLASVSTRRVASRNFTRSEHHRPSTIPPIGDPVDETRNLLNEETRR